MKPIHALLALLVLFILLEFWLKSKKEPGISIKLANAGELEAQKRLAEMYFKGNIVKQDYAKSVEWLEKAAAQNDVESQVKLGAIYFIGKGIAPDHKEAFISHIKSFKWYRKAAAQGHPEAQRYLGDAYHEGLGIDPDYPNALAWYLKAIEGGDIMARFKLGGMHEAGHGVAASNMTAYMWYTLAHKNAQNYGNMQTVMGERLAALREKMPLAEVKEAESLADKWQAEYNARHLRQKEPAAQPPA